MTRMYNPMHDVDKQAVHDLEHGPNSPEATQRRYQENRSKIIAANEAIQDLKATRRKVLAVREDAEALRNDVSGYEADRRWAGAARREFDSRKNDAREKMDSYLACIDEIVSRIDEEILKQQKQINALYALGMELQGLLSLDGNTALHGLGGIVNALDSIPGQIGEAFGGGR